MYFQYILLQVANVVYQHNFKMDPKALNLSQVGLRWLEQLEV